jgi:hypothetical protein
MHVIHATVHCARTNYSQIKGLDISPVSCTSNLSDQGGVRAALRHGSALLLLLRAQLLVEPRDELVGALVHQAVVLLLLPQGEWRVSDPHLPRRW